MYQQLIANGPIFKIMTESSLASVDFWCVFRKSVYSNSLGTFFFQLRKNIVVRSTLQTYVTNFSK